MIPSPVTHLAGLLGPDFLEQLAHSAAAVGEVRSAAEYQRRAGEWRGDRARLAALRSADTDPAPPDFTPDGFHHVYRDPRTGAELIRTDGAGSEWQGQRPLRAVPYYYRGRA